LRRAAKISSAKNRATNGKTKLRTLLSHPIFLSLAGAAFQGSPQAKATRAHPSLLIGCHQRHHHHHDRDGRDAIDNSTSALRIAARYFLHESSLTFPKDEVITFLRKMERSCSKAT